MILWWVVLALLLLYLVCEVLADRWMVPHFAVRSSFDYSRWLAQGFSACSAVFAFVAGLLVTCS